MNQIIEFINKHHRHHKPVVGHRFSVGAEDNGILVGVAIIGRPVARKTDQKNIDDTTPLHLALYSGQKDLFNQWKKEFKPKFSMLFSCGDTRFWFFGCFNGPRKSCRQKPDDKTAVKTGKKRRELLV